MAGAFRAVPEVEAQRFTAAVAAPAAAVVVVAVVVVDFDLILALVLRLVCVCVLNNSKEKKNPLIGRYQSEQEPIDSGSTQDRLGIGSVPIGRQM